MNTATPPSTTELRDAYNRVHALRFMGWSFEKALSVATVRWALEKSALAARRKNNTPAQPRLI